MLDIRVIDNGKGLPLENRDRLFEPYVTTRTKGTGLGLAIVKKIIEEHGGTIALTDAPGFDPDLKNGSVARIRLPRKPAGVGDHGPSRQASDLRDSGPQAERRGSRAGRGAEQDIARK